jgi:hypothetical protein
VANVIERKTKVAKVWTTKVANNAEYSEPTLQRQEKTKERGIELIRPAEVQRKLKWNIRKESLAGKSGDNICGFVCDGPGLDKNSRQKVSVNGRHKTKFSDEFRDILVSQTISL